MTNENTSRPDPTEKALAAALRGSAPSDERVTAANAAVLARAEGEGLVDVAYATLDSPYGELFVAATDRGVVKLGLPNRGTDGVLEQLASAVSPRVLESPARLDGPRRELDAFFEGKLHEFETPVDWSLTKGFTDKVLHVVASIPYGRTLSYGEVAERAGNPRAFRAAGTACGANPVPLIVPCHRVVQASGEPGNYGGGPEMKRSLLEHEGAL
ncbi:methylated-DNA--[protein]-cysteine S-methyltransferase [soil metagenome]